MNQLHRALSEIFNSNKLREKILVAPSFSSGHQIAESLVKEGHPYLNLRIKTPSSLAHDIASLDLAADAISLLSETSLLIFIEDIFSELKLKKDSYFTGIEVKNGIINALASSIYNLRICGIRSSDLMPKQFVSEQRGNEIIELLEKYESLLEDKKYADYPEVLNRAIERITKSKMPDQNQLYLILSDMPFSALEKKFIDLLPGEKIILPHDVPAGLISPDSYLSFSDGGHVNKPESDIDLLTWLFAPEKAPASFKDSSVQMFHAVGKRNEVREVMRRLISSGSKCDETEIIYTSYDDYVPLIYVSAIKSGIKATIEEGIPVTLTRC